MPNSFASLTPDYRQTAWAIEHAFCYYTLWQHVPADAPFSSPNLMELMQPVILSHSRDPTKRTFYEAVLPVALKVQPGCMEPDLNATLHVAAAAKKVAGKQGPLVPEDQQPASSFYACPNGSHKQGHPNVGSSSGGSGSSSSSSSSSSGSGSGSSHAAHRRMIEPAHGQHLHQHHGGGK